MLNTKKHKHKKHLHINKKKYVSIDDARTTPNVCLFEIKIPGTLVPIHWRIVFTVNTLYIELWTESNFFFAKDLFHFNRPKVIRKWNITKGKKGLGIN